MLRLALALFLSTAPLSAAIFQKIDTTLPLCCRFSNKHHNRILIEEGRVKKVIFPEEKLFVRMEDVSGQVFVQAKYLTQEPTLVSIVTQDGLVQDIEITFSDCPPQVIVLKDHSNLECLQKTFVSNFNGCSTLEGTISSILKSQIPEGYLSEPFRRSVIRPKFGISAKLVGKLKGSHDTLCLYEVSNTTCCRRKIFEKEIACNGTSWTFLEKNLLSPREKVLAVMAVKNE